MSECEILGQPQYRNTRGRFSLEHLMRLYTSAPQAFWRHDVDVSLDAAVQLARFATLAGVKTTFYVMLRGEFYNPFSRHGDRAIRAIVMEGHRVGLHVDHRSGLAPETVRRDWELLHFSGIASLVDHELVSFHMPTPDVLWTDFDGFEHAHGARWEGHYVSDSRREWDDDKEGAVMNRPNEGAGMQVALHAEHWFR